MMGSVREPEFAGRKTFNTAGSTKKRIYSPLGANILVGEKKVEIELKA